MKSRIKALCIASLLASGLAACGGGGGSGEPAAAEPTPVVPDVSAVPQQSNDPKDPQDPLLPQDPQTPEEPGTSPLPIAKQTGWSLYGGALASRKPLEMLKTILCSQLAAVYEEPAPQSSEACDTRFPGLQSGNEESMPAFQTLPPGTELVKREGCTYVPDQQMLACSWTYIGAHPGSSTGFIQAYVVLPFMPSFGAELETCVADKPHYFPGGLARGSVSADGPVTKAPGVPMGCVAWAEMADFFAYTEAGVRVEEYSPPN